MNFDLIVIGSGPGGYVCAIRAAQLGLKTAIVEKEQFGGTCLNKGCIPTKAILQTSKVRHLLEKSDEFGIISSFEKVDLNKMLTRTKNIISTLNKGVSSLLSKNRITVLSGSATFKERNTLIIDEKGKTSEITAPNIVIATGATPKLLPGMDENLIKSGLIWTSKEAIFPNRIPKNLLIIGSGAIGIELASFYNSIGTNVTVAEVQNRILIQEDREISETAKKLFEKQGIKFRLSTKSSNFQQNGNYLAVSFEDNNKKVENEQFDTVILAIGVVPNISSLNLDKVGIKTKPNGIIETFEFQETSVKGIYAIGDVADAPWLAHKASREGIICAEKISGQKYISKSNQKHIPSCTYSNPQIASIGLTEEETAKNGRKIKVGKSHFKGNGKAMAIGDSSGFVKVLFDEKTGELLGAHMIGYEVTELIPIFSIAISAELTEKEFIEAIFPHPTLSECIQEAVCSAYNCAIHG